MAYQLNSDNEWYAQNYAKSLEDYGSYEKAEEIYKEPAEISLFVEEIL